MFVVLGFLLFDVLVRVLSPKLFRLRPTVGLAVGVEFPVHVQAQRPGERREQTAEQEKLVPVHFEHTDGVRRTTTLAFVYEETIVVVGKLAIIKGISNRVGDAERTYEDNSRQT